MHNISSKKRANAKNHHLYIRFISVNTIGAYHYLLMHHYEIKLVGLPMQEIRLPLHSANTLCKFILIVYVYLFCRWRSNCRERVLRSYKTV